MRSTLIEHPPSTPTVSSPQRYSNDFDKKNIPALTLRACLRTHDLEPGSSIERRSKSGAGHEILGEFQPHRTACRGLARTNNGLHRPHPSGPSPQQIPRRISRRSRNLSARTTLLQTPRGCLPYQARILGIY